jgi:hypothetical protein
LANGEIFGWKLRGEINGARRARIVHLEFRQLAVRRRQKRFHE